MSRRKFKSNKRTNISLVVALLLCISVGFALIGTNLNIIGTTNISSTKWDVHWANLSVTNGSVTGSQVTTPAAIKTGNTEVEFSITLNKPGEYYEFTVDAVNQGTLDAMINSVTNKVYESNGTTEKTLPAYLNYTVTYDDGIAIAQYHKLAASTTEKIKVRVEFKSDVTAEQLPQTAETTVFKFSVNYIQADSNAIDRPLPSFSDDDWSAIVSKVKSGNIPSNYNVGDTKEVDMGSLGTHTLRIANTTTPEECSTEGFSQTACGFVLEFADIITTHRMNPYTSGDSNLNGTTVNGTGNKGGWEYSDMRAFLNSTTYANESIDYSTTGIYSSLPEVLRNAIIDTRVVSGHGSVDTTNYTTTDKLYLLSRREVWNYIGSFDTASKQTRQMDYYASQGVTTSSYAAAIKKNSSSTASSWWLRSADSYYTNTFDTVRITGDTINGNPLNPSGVAPAFRIA